MSISHHLQPTTLLIAVVLLTSCTTNIQGYIDDAKQTASGRLVDLKDAVQEIAEPVTNAVEDANRRIDAAADGINSVKDGVNKLKGAVSGKE